ncbi:MAG: cytochrome c-type biogenesis protein CcmH [Rhodobacteraceae bacterium]|nr:cytochrome c-type biogenesis protein CcmH [Paracoccaceae bacterium]
MLRSRASLTAVALLTTLSLAAPVGAVEPEEILADPALETRAREISKDLRCVVCQNQSIDESDASIAADMRKLVRVRLEAGDSDDEVREVLVSSYGEYVLLTPKFSISNAFIWGAPFAALLIGGLWYLRRTGRAAVVVAEAPAGPVAPPLSDEEKARLEKVLKS